MNDNNTRTPQPGDVWETEAGHRLIITPGDYFEDHEYRYLSDFKLHSITGTSPDLKFPRWRYIGRACDLIAEALAWREAKAMLGDTSKETPHD